MTDKSPERIEVCLAACADEDTAYMKHLLSLGKTLRSYHEETLIEKERYRFEFTVMEAEYNAMKAEREKLLKALKQMFDGLVEKTV